ncbi:hypothetical protein [Brucella intermedia]|uniref:hypothetical protein n=1 Tax=Brucella intermedia TaxID=94625 RepID=UPI00244CC3D3|nr:hypothetical protein [Brucella intermedia]WGG58799.1 hypothetical protein QA414_10740 [Brucella intermedia]
MTTATDLLASVQSALGMASGLGYSKSSAAHDVYEAYILSLFCQAASELGWGWFLRDGTGKSTTQAVFRLGPGRLPSGNFTHIYLSRSGNQPLEAHIGVKVVGKALKGVSKQTKSGHLLHEFDLLVLPEQVAAACRATNDDPHHSSTVVHAEAKFYGNDLPLPIGRSLVGLAIECDLKNKSVLVTNQNGFAVQDLVEHYGVTFRFLIKPSNPTGEYHLIKSFKHLLSAAP